MKVSPCRPTTEAICAKVRFAPSAMPMSFHGKPVNMRPRAHSLTPRPNASARIRQGPDDQRKPASAKPTAGKMASPAGSATTLSGSAQRNLSAIDQAGRPDPPESDEKIAEAEPPAGAESRLRARKAGRTAGRRRRSIDQPHRDAHRDNHKDEKIERRQRESADRPGQEGDRASAPAPAQDHACRQGGERVGDRCRPGDRAQRREPRFGAAPPRFFVPYVATGASYRNTRAFSESSTVSEPLKFAFVHFRRSRSPPSRSGAPCVSVLPEAAKNAEAPSI